MPKKKKYDNPDQLELFPVVKTKQSSEQQDHLSDHLTKKQKEAFENISDLKVENTDQKNIVENTKVEEKTSQIIKSEKFERLILPFTYEQIVQETVGEQKARLPDLIVPVKKFEEQIIQILEDIRNAGFLLFFYGISGVGKSTFISSLEFQKYIPIQKIIPINASELIQGHNSGLKLKRLINQIKNEAIDFFSSNNNPDDKLCIVIDYLENLQDEEENHVKAFFRDLNGLLRKYSILIVWPVTVGTDLEVMQKFAKSFSSTMFHRRIPVIKFTGPPIEKYPEIAKNTIKFFNDGKSCYEFQINDSDLEQLKQKYNNKPAEKHLIRDYLQDVISIWEQRTDYVSEITKSIPKPTEVWFVFSYPKAEDVVARFAKQTPDIIDEMWNADYKSLNAYIGRNQRAANWKPRRLTLALSSRMLTTKIMYLPTNALVACMAAYADDTKINLTREELIDPDGKYQIKNHWLQKKVVQKTLSTTPLYLQLSGKPTRPGFRSSGAVPTALSNAQVAFEQLNNDISQKNISDQHINHAISLTLQDLFKEKLDYHFSHETRHPYLENIRPDISVETPDKIICLEFCYTKDDTPGNLANYVLNKLNQYMKQLEDAFGIPEDFLK